MICLKSPNYFLTTAPIIFKMAVKKTKPTTKAFLETVLEQPKENITKLSTEEVKAGLIKIRRKVISLAKMLKLVHQH